MVVAAALFLLFAALAYEPLLHAGFIWDDDSYVTENKTLRDADGLRRIWLVPEATPQYYPLVHTSFWVEYHLWGLNPLGYHIVNVILHALAALLLYIVLVRLRLPGAWLAAAIFTLHPVEVETVAWVTERKNLLSAVFHLAAALAYLRFSPTEEDEVPGVGRWGWYFISLILFVCALFSKTVACSLPAALLLVYWWKTGKVRRKNVLPLLPYFCVGIALGLGTAWLEKTHVHAEGPEWDLTFAQRCLIAGRALWFYASKLVWPHPLTFIYPRWTIDPSQVWQWLFPAAAIGVVATLWALRKRIGRGPLTGVLFFAGTLAPALGFFNVYPMRYSFVADHFQYLASIGLIVLIAFALSRAPTWTPAPLLVLLGILTWHQAKIYRSAETVWRATLRDNPTASIARNNLSQILLSRGDIDPAIELCREVLAVKPDPVAELNLGYGLLQKGQLDEAIAHCRQSIAEQPIAPEAYYDIAQACLKKSQFAEAITNFQMATRLKPDYPAAFCNLGYALLQTGRVPEAIASYEKSIALDPDYALPHNDLGSIELRLEQTNDALLHFQRAAELAPKFVEAHYNLASLLLAEGKLDEARNECEKVIEQRPELAQAHYLLGKLGAAYSQRGRMDMAATVTEQALKLAQAAHENELAEKLSRQLQSYRAP
jgi:tetratricopeptide (TPR) repeat protein